MSPGDETQVLRGRTAAALFSIQSSMVEGHKQSQSSAAGGKKALLHPPLLGSETCGSG